MVSGEQEALKQLTGKPGSQLGADILSAAGELPDQQLKWQRDGPASPEPTPHSEPAPKPAEKVWGDLTAQDLEKAGQALEWARDDQAEQQYAADRADAYEEAVWDAESDEEVTQLLDAAWAEGNSEAVSRIAEADEATTREWLLRKTIEAAAAETFESKAQKDAFRQGLTQAYTEAITPTFQRHSTPDYRHRDLRDTPHPFPDRVQGAIAYELGERQRQSMAEGRILGPKEAQATAELAAQHEQELMRAEAMSAWRHEFREAAGSDFRDRRTGQLIAPDSLQTVNIKKVARRAAVANMPPEERRQQIKDSVMAAAPGESRPQGGGIEWLPQAYDAHGRPLPRETKSLNLEQLLGRRLTATESRALTAKLSTERLRRSL